MYLYNAYIPCGFEQMNYTILYKYVFININVEGIILIVDKLIEYYPNKLICYVKCYPDLKPDFLITLTSVGLKKSSCEICKSLFWVND